MKRYALIFALLTILLLLTVSALAQDDATAVPTDSDVPAETQEATALETEQAIATQEVVVIVTQTPEQSPTPTLTPTPEMTAVPGTGGDGSTGGTGSTGSNDPLYFLAVGVLIVVLAFGMLDRWTNYQLSQKAISQIPPEWLPFIQKGLETAQKVGYERAGGSVAAVSVTVTGRVSASESAGTTVDACGSDLPTIVSPAGALAISCTSCLFGSVGLTIYCAILFVSTAIYPKRRLTARMSTPFSCIAATISSTFASVP